MSRTFSQLPCESFVSGAQFILPEAVCFLSYQCVCITTILLINRDDFFVLEDLFHDLCFARLSVDLLPVCVVMQCQM
jgi:hypothetical protein